MRLQSSYRYQLLAALNGVFNPGTHRFCPQKDVILSLAFTPSPTARSTAVDALPNNQPTNPPGAPTDNAANDPIATLTAAQLSDIKAQLDLVLMALEALTHIGSESVLEAAKALKLENILSDRVGLWRLRQSSPLRKGQGRKKLDIEEARALVLVICHLSAAHHEAVRQAVATLEQATQKGEPPHRAAILGDYLDNFSNLYSDRMSEDALIGPATSAQNTTLQSVTLQGPVAQTAATQTLTQLSFRLLVDLLFYSAPHGERQLWLALLDRAVQ